jgi:NAD(P)-dependent dehydrogenase (short-subunit alcohol dehydrogenase family)
LTTIVIGVQKRFQLMSDSRKIAAVTGGSRGIGRAIVERLAAAGYDVVVGYRSDEASAQSVADAVRAAGRRALPVAVDITDGASVAAFVEAATSFGLLSGVVVNAGAVCAVGRLEDLDPEDLQRDIEVNVLGPVLTCRAAIGPLKQTQGSLVLIGSAAVGSGSPGTYVHYAAAKAAIATLTIGLSKELAPQGIRVNCVEPGTVWSDFHKDPERPAKVAATIPMGRPGEPAEIAGAVAWLLSSEASYATGAILRVAGGL